MAHFRGTVQGGRSAASRLGHKTTGIDTSANGWHAGVSVRGSYQSEKDRDVFRVVATPGSGYGSQCREIAEVLNTAQGQEVRHHFPGGKIVVVRDGRITFSDIS